MDAVTYQLQAKAWRAAMVERPKARMAIVRSGAAVIGGQRQCQRSRLQPHTKDAPRRCAWDRYESPALVGELLALL
ncbi:MAG: hypothetical protein GPOALKHO_001318 [Sodalis sp.]|nr:MAG: hypothetical protein GPOALKHO_001318 [Sodalis sp.]